MILLVLHKNWFCHNYVEISFSNYLFGCIHKWRHTTLHLDIFIIGTLNTWILDDPVKILFFAVSQFTANTHTHTYPLYLCGKISSDFELTKSFFDAFKLCLEKTFAPWLSKRVKKVQLSYVNRLHWMELNVGESIKKIKLKFVPTKGEGNNFKGFFLTNSKQGSNVS